MLYEQGRFAVTDAYIRRRGSPWLLCMGVCLLILLFGKAHGGAILLAVLLHESGHWFAAKLCRVQLTGIRFDICGMRMQLAGVVSYGVECIIALGGPAVNLLCFLLIPVSKLPFPAPLATDVLYFREISLYLGLFNLLPVGTMDGGRVLRVMLSLLFSPRIAEGAIKCITLLLLLFLWLAAAYALLRGTPMTSAFLFLLTLLLRFGSPDRKQREI